MPTAHTSRITLDLEPGADPIRGSIERPDGSRQLFWGWLELMDELRRAAGDKPEAPSQSTPPSTGPPGEPEPSTHATAAPHGKEAKS